MRDSQAWKHFYWIGKNILPGFKAASSNVRSVLGERTGLEWWIRMETRQSSPRLANYRKGVVWWTPSAQAMFSSVQYLASG
jgi:hypothetical protein